MGNGMSGTRLLIWLKEKKNLTLFSQSNRATAPGTQYVGPSLDMDVQENMVMQIDRSISYHEVIESHLEQSLRGMNFSHQKKKTLMW